MKKLILAGIAFFLLSFNTMTWAATTNPNFIAAQTVIQNWFTAMKNNQTDVASSYLAPKFVSIHTDGIVRNKTQEVKLMKSMNMQNFQLTNFKFTQSGNTIVVTYKDQGVEQIDNKATGTQPAGRMAILQSINGKLLIIAYANLDTIS